jgi:cytochrome c oxidase cbb3-type subunit 3
MPAWGKSLSPLQVRDVTFYILSLQGSKPANAKSPQGEIFKEAVFQPDSSKIQAAR